MIEQKQNILENILKEGGIDIKKLSPEIKNRLFLLEKMDVLSDAENALKTANLIFKNSPNKWDELDKKTVIVGTIFSDIGKTGPKNADHFEQKLISDMFSKENVDGKISVKDFLYQYFPSDALIKKEKFESLGLNAEMLMREFWNLHVIWTFDIISGDKGIPEESKAAAVTHHILENINPENIVGKDGKFTKYFGENCCFDRAEKLVILLDKYDAYRRRSKMSHKEAINALKEVVKKNKYYDKDAEFYELIDVLEKIRN